MRLAHGIRGLRCSHRDRSEPSALPEKVPPSENSPVRGPRGRSIARGPSGRVVGICADETMMLNSTGRSERRGSVGWLVVVSALALATIGVGPARGEVPTGRRPSWFRLIRGEDEAESAVVQELRRRLAEKDREIAALQDEL